MSREATSNQPRMIPVLIFALCVFALLRAANVWVSFNGAEAAAEIDEPPMIAFVEPATPDAAPEAPSDAPALEPEASPSDRRILEQLAGRRASLDAREEDLDTREKLLGAAELRLEERIAEINLLREELMALSAERNRAEQEEFSTLSNAYERMKPRDAARIFEVLEKDILVPVAAGMRTQALAGVLAEMKPEKARALTRELAGRSRLEAAAGAGPQ